MIFGVGVDLVEVDRIAVILDRWGERFARRVLTDAELEEWRARRGDPHFLARRFAAKEAASKAFGTGISGGVSFRGIGVTHDERGRPGLLFHDDTRALVARLGITASHLSLSDEQRMAAAVVVLERAD